MSEERSWSRIELDPKAWAVATVLESMHVRPAAAKAALQTLTSAGEVADVMIALVAKVQAACAGWFPVQPPWDVFLGGDALGQAVVAYTLHGDREAAVTAVSQCLDDQQRVLATVTLLVSTLSEVRR